MSIKNSITLFVICSITALSGCKKYLEEKPDKKLVIISSLQDLQALLDMNSAVNRGYGSCEAAADNYYVSYADYAAQSEFDRNLYAWNKERQFPTNTSTNNWSILYDIVYRANTVLQALDKIQYAPLEQQQWNNVKGQALFLRARNFLSVAAIWAPAWDNATAASDLGIPLRLDPDFNLPSVRSSVAATYDQIISDLKGSLSLLPVTPVSATRASVPAAYALLARTYLYMRKYDSAYRYSNLSLSQRNSLYDFNNLPLSATYPFSSITFDANPEVLFYSTMQASIMLYPPMAHIDSVLYRSYDANDLRKQAFFKSNGDNTYQFKGSVLGESFFDGLAVNEMYLTKAESAARLGDLTTAMDNLNIFMKKRWKNTSFTLFTAATAQDALAIITTERRKELLMTDTRWMDIKRLNKEGANITLKRIINGQQYLLPPNDLRYAMAIPDDIIALTGMPQNPR